jgi:hypothetical protein
VAFDATAWDTHGMHDDVVDNTRMTCVAAGLYIITASLEWASNPIGWRTALLRVNNATNAAYDQCLAVNGAETILSITAQHLLQQGDSVELIVRQNCGSPLDLGGGPHVETSLSVTWVAA